MRSMLAATLIFVTSTGAFAQMTTPPLPGTRPKPVQTIPIRPSLQTPAATADANAHKEANAAEPVKLPEAKPAEASHATPEKANPEQAKPHKEKPRKKARRPRRRRRHRHDDDE